MHRQSSQTDGQPVDGLSKPSRRLFILAPPKQDSLTCMAKDHFCSLRGTSGFLRHRPPREWAACTRVARLNFAVPLVSSISLFTERWSVNNGNDIASVGVWFFFEPDTLLLVQTSLHQRLHFDGVVGHPFRLAVHPLIPLSRDLSAEFLINRTQMYQQLTAILPCFLALQRAEDPLNTARCTLATMNQS